MNTTTHILFAEAVFRRKTIGRSGWAAAAGGLLPDAFIGVFLVSAAVQDVSRDDLWDVEYFKEPWATIGAISNSFFLWGILAIGALVGIVAGTSDPVKAKSKIVAVFAASGLSHVVFDFLTHADDAHQHLWPISDWRFFSPVSYWDPAHNSHWVMPLEGILILACVVVLWRQISSTAMRVVLGLSAGIGVALIVGSFF